MIMFHSFCYDTPDISSCSSKRNTNSDIFPLFRYKNFFSKSLKVNPFSFSIVISHKSPYHWSLTNLIIRFIYVIDGEEF